MANACTSFLRKHDSLGLGVRLHHKSNATFGTVAGGCASIAVNTFTFIFILFQLYALCFYPDFDSTQATSYLSNANPAIYSVQTSDFMPSFGVFTQPDDKSEPLINDETLVKWSWIDVSKGNRNDNIKTVKCQDIVKRRTDLTEA